MNKLASHGIGLGSSVAVTALLDSPFVTKMLSAIVIAIVSTVVSQLTQRLFQKRKS
jgi:uncharacterized membrane protein YvlD (DUF360 family)